MPTECNPVWMRFARLKGRDVVVADSGSDPMTSDAGALLLGATDRAIGPVDQFSDCFWDGRSSDRVVHDVETLVGQRVFGIAPGYEDLLDQDELCHDPVLGAVPGRLEARRRDCAPPAGKLTLNRLEHAPVPAGRQAFPSSGLRGPTHLSETPRKSQGLATLLFPTAGQITLSDTRTRKRPDRSSRW